MAVPIIILGVAGVLGAVGVGAGGNAVYKNSKAKKINKQANITYDLAKRSALREKRIANTSLENLGRCKLEVLNGSVKQYLDIINNIANLGLKESPGLGELKLDNELIIQMNEMVNIAGAVVGGVVGGAGAGALAAYGAYSATMTFAAASTGTAIASLSGAAATNATLAFLGGGSLAAGGGGMALGSVVLGGAVAGPAIAVLGVVMNATAGKNLDNAYSNKAEAEKLVAEFCVVESLCKGITSRCRMFQNELKAVESILKRCIIDIRDIVTVSGYDYNNYSEEEQSVFVISLKTLEFIKRLLDTPMLTENGKLTHDSEVICLESKNFVKEQGKFIETVHQ